MMRRRGEKVGGDKEDEWMREEGRKGGEREENEV